MPGKVYTFSVQQEDVGVQGKCRLDLWLLAQETLACSRSQVRKLIVAGEVSVNAHLETKPGHWVKASDQIVVTLPEPRPLNLVAEDVPLDIVYEDDHLLVLNKPAGMVVHPAPGHYEGTLVHALLHHCQTLSGIGGVQRPGIVHRLDRDTSGVMLVTKTDEAHARLSQQLKARELSRIYYAVVHGRLKTATGQIEAPIGRHPKERKKMAVAHKVGRYALTCYQVIQQYAEHALLEIALQTGRTHQIRVHMKYIQHPIVGDLMYGHRSKSNLDMPRQALHAKRIIFIHPLTQERMMFEVPLPEDMNALLEKLSHC